MRSCGHIVLLDKSTILRCTVTNAKDDLEASCENASVEGRVSVFDK